MLFQMYKVHLKVLFVLSLLVCPFAIVLYFRVFVRLLPAQGSFNIQSPFVFRKKVFSAFCCERNLLYL